MLHDTTPLKFQPGILIFYVLGFVLYIVVFTFTYSFYRNAQMKVYNKLHYRLLTYFLFVLVLFLLLLGASIITFWHYANDSNLFINNFYMLPMSWILAGLSALHFGSIIFVKLIVNQNKKQISHFRTENFTQLLFKLEQTRPDDAYLNRFKTKHARYFSILQQQEKLIHLSIENYHKENYEQTLLNILVFNDNYTTKWSKRNNYFQLKLFYEFCIELQKKLK